VIVITDSTVYVPALPPGCVKPIDWGECTFEKDPSGLGARTMLARTRLASLP